MKPFFTAFDAWSGGFFELSLEFSSLEVPIQIRAVQEIWQHGTLRGCYLERDVEPTDQACITPSDTETSLLGSAVTPAGIAFPCTTFFIAAEESTWLSLAFPMASLSLAYPVGAFPIADGTPLHWREEVSSWLRDIAYAVYQVAPFQLGLIGWEPDDAELSSARIRAEGIPAERYEGLLIPEAGVLRWVPPNRGASMTFGRGGA